MDYYEILECSTERQRVYQLPFKVKNIKGMAKTIKELWKYDPVTLNDGYELAEDISESIDKICISDAITHIERLVFPAYYVRNINTGNVFLSVRANDIDGIMTISLDGGNPRYVYPDEVYIRHLRILNKNN